MRVSKIGKYLSRLYVQVLIGIVAGILVGHFYPDIGSQLKPLGDLFIKLIRMLLAPIIFASVVVGIARMNDLHEAGRVGVKAVLYFELASTIALMIGLVIVDVIRQPASALSTAGKVLWIVALLLVPIFAWIVYGFWRMKQSRL